MGPLNFKKVKEEQTQPELLEKEKKDIDDEDLEESTYQQKIMSLILDR